LVLWGVVFCLDLGPFFFFFPCRVFFPLFIYLFHIIPNSYMPSYSLVSFFLPLSGAFSFIYFIYLTLFPTHTCPCTLSTLHSSIGVQILHAFTIIMSVAFLQLLKSMPGPWAMMVFTSTHQHTIHWMNACYYSVMDEAQPELILGSTLVTYSVANRSHI